jgi:hypothetical protein
VSAGRTMAGPAGRAGADVPSSRGFLADESGVGDRGLVADGMLAMFSSEVCECVNVIISDDPFFTMLLWTTSGKKGEPDGCGCCRIFWQEGCFCQSKSARHSCRHRSPLQEVSHISRSLSNGPFSAILRWECDTRLKIKSS